MQGLHLTADLSHCHCDLSLLTDATKLGSVCAELVSLSGLNAQATLTHRFPDSSQGAGGVTAAILLAESHLCVHTWPEKSAVTLDVYVCNFGGDHSAKAHALMDSLLALFNAEKVQRHALQRGM